MAADNNKPQAAEEPEVSLAFIEQYKLYVQSADNNSARRVSVNRYQTSLNMGVVHFVWGHRNDCGAANSSSANRGGWRDYCRLMVGQHLVDQTPQH